MYGDDGGRTVYLTGDGVGDSFRHSVMAPSSSFLDFGVHARVEY